MKLLPFNFERLECGDYFISNLSGHHDFLSSDTLIGLLEGELPKNNLVTRRLASKLFISDHEQFETSIALLSSGLGKKLVSELTFSPIYMIVPTLRCDHSCKYCQVSRAPLNAKELDLDIDRIKNIVHTISLLSPPPYKIEIQGGEPLLRFDLIKELYASSHSILGSQNFELIITSSLSLLNDEMLDWARDRNLLFSTSLDGDEITHNTNRILPSSDSYQLAKSAIQKIHRELGPGRVATVTTVTKELIERPSEIIISHLELGIHDLFIRPISPYGFANNRSFETYSINEYMNFYREVFEIIKSHNKAGLKIVEHSAAIHMKRIFQPGFSQYADLKSPSGYILNTVLFNYDGRIYGSDESRMLQRVLPEFDLSCGSLDSPSFHNELNKTIISNSFNAIQPGCSDCAYQPFCGSDPCQSIASFGEPTGHKPSSIFCKYHKSMFRFLVGELRASETSSKLLKSWINE